MEGGVGAGDGNPIEGELGKRQVECSAQSWAPRRASKEGRPLLIILRVRTPRGPGEVTSPVREVVCLDLGDHCPSVLRDTQI